MLSIPTGLVVVGQLCLGVLQYWLGSRLHLQQNLAPPTTALAIVGFWGLPESWKEPLKILSVSAGKSELEHL